MTGKRQLTITDMTVFTLRVPVIGTRKQGIVNVNLFTHMQAIERVLHRLDQTGD